MALPTNIGYGTVVGRFLLGYADGVDVDLYPDGVAAQGSIFFTPSPAYIKDEGALDGSTAAPVTILPATVEATLDSGGYLCGPQTTDNSSRGIRLVATDDADTNPTSWTWKATFRLTDASGTAISLSDVSFSLPQTTTVDLTAVRPIAASNGTFYTKGDKGDTGDAGPANTLTVSTTTGAAGTDAEATISGTSPNQSIAFVIPRGDKGDKGDDGNTGSAATVSAGSTTTGAAGSSASVTNSGTTSAAVFDFTIPRGDKGDKGDKGDTGDTGPRGEGLTVLGSVPTVGDLPATGNTEADAYIVVADGHLYIWVLGSPDYWLDSGQIQGPAGEGVPAGGAANTFLIKSTSADYDTEWTNIIDGGTA